MFADHSRRFLAIVSMLLIFSLACGISLDMGESDEPDADAAVEQTLQALYAQYTAEAMAAGAAAQNAQPAVEAPAADSGPAPVTVTH